MNLTPYFTHTLACIDCPTSLYLGHSPSSEPVSPNTTIPLQIYVPKRSHVLVQITCQAIYSQDTSLFGLLVLPLAHDHRFSHYHCPNWECLGLSHPRKPILGQNTCHVLACKISNCIKIQMFGFLGQKSNVTSLIQEGAPAITLVPGTRIQQHTSLAHTRKAHALINERCRSKTCAFWFRRRINAI